MRRIGSLLTLLLCSCGASANNHGHPAASDLAMGPAGPTCGDNVCNGGEDCQTCASDCGACLPCNYSPTCMDASGAPASP